MEVVQADVRVQGGEAGPVGGQLVDSPWGTPVALHPTL